MNKMARATGITVLAALVGMGLGACSTEPPAVAPQTASASASASASTQSADPSEAAIKSEINAFFADVSKETKTFVAEMKSSQSASSKLTKEQQMEKVRTSFKDSFSHLDESKIGAEKSMPLVGIFAERFDSIPGAVLTVEDEGITVDGDSATVDGAYVTLAVDGKSDTAGADHSPGKFALKRSSDGWKITDFEPKTASTPEATATPSK